MNNAGDYVIHDPAPADTRPAGDVHAAVAACKLMLEAIGIDCSSESTTRTPERLVNALAELTGGMFLDPSEHLKVTFPGERDRQPALVVVQRIGFVSLCEHHCLPFAGTATVGYLPVVNGRIFGLSKIPRVVREFAARPQVQERLGAQILDALTKAMPIAGAGVVLQSEHCCMTMRGVTAAGASMVTTHLAGELDTNNAIRAEFLRRSGI